VSQTLPAGTPLTGYVSPDLSHAIGVGQEPQEEIDWAEARNAAQEEDAEAVAEWEDTVATLVHDVRLDESGVQLASLVPDWVQIGGEEPVLLHVHGSGFTEATQIWWHDHLETTVFVSENELTTWVCPWLFLAPDIIDVGVGEPAPPPEEDPPLGRVLGDEAPITLPFRLLL
jgi:hypothetical protein